MRIKRSALFAVIVMAFAANIWAKADSPPKVGQWSANEWTWTKERWDGDETPYKKARLEIDRAVQEGRDLDALIEKYKAAARENATDPLPQFRWGYTAYQSAAKAGSDAAEKLQGVEFALKMANSPHTYEYARLRFLVAARSTPFHLLKGVGERLLSRNAKDNEVRFYLISVLDPGFYPTEKSLALELVEEQIRAQPKRPSSYSSKANVYLSLWSKSKSSSDADNAISAYRQFLQLAPQGHPHRKQAIAWIKFLESKKS